MPIQSGTHLGPYEITGAIGAGGMGEVYRARDKRSGVRRKLQKESAKSRRSSPGRNFATVRLATFSGR